jgi:hypothetical protein
MYSIGTELAATRRAAILRSTFAGSTASTRVTAGG